MSRYEPTHQPFRSFVQSNSSSKFAKFTSETPRSTLYEQVIRSPLFMRIMLLGFSAWLSLRAVGFYTNSYANTGRIVNPHLNLPTVRVNVRASLAGLAPWPLYQEGKLSWYRQGLRDVASHRALIEQLADDDVPAVLLAAAIANQGNSYQRPFGWERLEQAQIWLGEHVQWPQASWAQWQWVRSRWEADFEQYSVGIAQITPQEARTLATPRFGQSLAPTQAPINLLDDTVSIRLMWTKLAAHQRAAAAADLQLNETDRFILSAIANNDGPAVLQAYVARGGDLITLLNTYPGARMQLAKIMSYINYLHQHEGWPLPVGVNCDHIWWLIRTTPTTP